MSLTHQLFLQSLRELDEVSAAAFDDHRGPLIATMLDHLWRHVPAYHERLARFVVDEGFDLAHWTELPLLRPAELARQNEAFIARSLRAPAEETEEVASPAQVPITRRSELSRMAAECERERCYELFGVDLTARLAVLHPDHAGGPTSGRGWSITFTRNEWFAGAIEAPAAQQLDWLAEIRPRVLRTTADLATRLAAAAIELRRTHELEAVIIADDFPPAHPDGILKQAFGAKVFHVVERPVLGVLAAGDGASEYAVPAGTAIVEVVDAGGRTVGAGQMGELTITPLYEFATPLLRFATGIAAIMPEDSEVMLGVRSLAGINGFVR